MYVHATGIPDEVLLHPLSQIPTLIEAICGRREEKKNNFRGPKAWAGNQSEGHVRYWSKNWTPNENLSLLKKKTSIQDSQTGTNCIQIM